MFIRKIKIYKIRLLIILFQLNTFLLANTNQDISSRKLFIEDYDYSRKSISHLNTMVIVTNNLRIGINKKEFDPEKILNDLIYNNNIFRNVKDSIITVMEKTIRKDQIESDIEKYIDEAAFIKGKKRGIIDNALNELDIILNLVISQTQLKIILFNRKGDQIGLYKKNLTNRLIQEHIKGEVTDIFNEFMDRYFFQTIKVPRSNNLVGDIYINDKLQQKKWEGSVPVELNNILRYNDITVYIVTNDSVSYNITEKGEIFSLNERNKKKEQKKVRYQKLTDSPIFKAKGSLIRFNLFNYKNKPLTSENVIFDLYDVNLFSFNNVLSKKINTGTGNFNVSIPSVGLHLYTLKRRDYMGTFPQFIYLADSIEYKVSNNGKIFSIDKEINHKSKTIGRGLSTLVPGLGHLYVDRSKIQNLVFTGLYWFLMYKTMDEYNNFIFHKNEYVSLQSKYNDLDYTASNSTYSDYETKAVNYYNSAQTSKNLFYSYLSGVIVTNLLSTLHLELRMNWDL